ncbi:MAG: hypothetical protein ACRD2W_00780, partial [Acidimicrobiales bacterium]
MSLATGLTADEFLARDDWPRGSQLIAGEVVVNQPLLPHQLVLGNLYAYCRAWVEAEPGRGLVGLADLDAPLIGAFLEHLERDRHNGIRTRNNRLAAVHSLFSYAAL